MKELHCDCGAVLDSPDDIRKSGEMIKPKYHCQYCDTDLGDAGKSLYFDDL